MPHTPPAVQFLNRTQATAYVKRHHMSYLRDTLQCATNASARKYTCADTFGTLLRDWTPEERRELTRLVHALATTCWSWRALMRDRWTFIQSDDTLEDGMPHTMHHAIVLPRWMVRELLPESASSPHATSTAVETLLHERIHVLQKTYPKRFAALYTRWGCVPVDDHPHVRRLHTERTYRTNPDTPSKWAYKREGTLWYPFVEMHSPSLTDTSYHLVHVGSSWWNTRWHNMDDVAWHEAYFGGHAHCYHPDETAAVLLAREMATDVRAHNSRRSDKVESRDDHDDNKDINKPCEAVDVLRRWCGTSW